MEKAMPILFKVIFLLVGTFGFFLLLPGLMMAFEEQETLEELKKISGKLEEKKSGYKTRRNSSYYIDLKLHRKKQLFRCEFCKKKVFPKLRKGQYLTIWVERNKSNQKEKKQYQIRQIASGQNILFSLQEFNQSNKQLGWALIIGSILMIATGIHYWRKN